MGRDCHLGTGLGDGLLVATPYSADRPPQDDPVGKPPDGLAIRWCTETMTEERLPVPDGDRLAGLERPLRNRVTPAGELIATEHRGTMYGNRGVLHNATLALGRRHQVRRWLVCVLEFRGRRRPIMRPRRYTELFFLDEAVALAAGHRPCAECRHAAYQSFRTAWTAARALPAKPAADDIDQVLHWQRRLVDGARVTYPALLSELPDGVFIVHEEEFWLANDGGLNRWTPAGYTDRIDQFDGPAAVLTPRTTVEAIRAGYRPLVHLHASLPETVCGSRRARLGGIAWSGGSLLSGVVADEPGGPVEGGVGFVEEGGEGLEDVRDAGSDVQDDGHVVGCGLRGEAGGVVEEHLVRSGLDQQRGQP